MAWFDKLEDELDRMEMDEKLLEYKIENSRKKVQKELMEGKKPSTHSVQVQQETDEELDKKRPLAKDILDDQDQTSRTNGDKADE